MSAADTLPYAVGREIDDIEALIDRADGPAFLYGHSSGGPLAMRAAIRLGSKVSKIALYEPPYNKRPWRAGILEPVPRAAERGPGRRPPPGVPRLRYAEVTALGGDPGLSAPANPTGPGSTAGQSHATCIRIR